MKTIDLALEGMTCGHCVSSLRKALGALDGVAIDDAQIGTATVTFDPARVTTERLVAAAGAAGFPARVAHERQA